MADTEGTEHTEQDTEQDTGQPGFEQKPSEETIQEIEEERERRLDPDNRPEHSEVDNSGATLPTVEEFRELTAEEETEGSAGSSDPSEAFREKEVSEEEVREIEEERKRRLAPENRPEHSEVDNTGDKRPDVSKDENQPE